MAMQADSLGRVTGTFTIPANIPTGTKSVILRGESGSRAEATYTGTHFLQTIVRRQRRATLYGDPLAQTFQARKDTIFGGVDIWVAAKGTSRIEVQLRTTDVGMPTQTIISRASLAPSEITVGAFNRFTWQPVRLAANTEYALVVLCDDADAAIGVAELGKWDTVSRRWITRQPYSIGVLLSSSNASTWTPHQNMDMAFRLLEATFTSTSSVYDYGVVAVDDATDLLVDAPIEPMATGSSIRFELTMPGGDVYTVVSGQALALDEAVTGDIGIRALLNGTTEGSPVLLPGMQLFVGTTQTTGDYITRIMPAGNPSTVTVTFDSITPGSSSVAVECQPSSGGSTWTEVPFLSGQQVGDGWVEKTHRISDYTGVDVRVRLTLTGSAVERPKARNLRIVVT